MQLRHRTSQGCRVDHVALGMPSWIGTPNRSLGGADAQNSSDQRIEGSLDIDGWNVLNGFAAKSIRGIR